MAEISIAVPKKRNEAWYAAVQNNVHVAWNAFDPNATSSSYLACTKLKGGDGSPFLRPSPISFSYALSQLPRYVLLLIWRLWHFNFHLTRPAYIIFIIQANLLAATRRPPTVSFPRPLQVDRVTLAPQMSGFYRGEGL